MSTVNICTICNKKITNTDLKNNNYQQDLFSKSYIHIDCSFAEQKNECCKA